MNIIMGTEQAKLFEGKYTVLELDTFKIMPDSRITTAYCVIENIPITELPDVDNQRNLHYNLLENYRKKDWSFCVQALEHLVGKWGGELDSFYTDLQNRIIQYQERDPGEDWDGFLIKI